MDLIFILEVLVGLAGAAMMVYAVVAQLTTVSALAQQGSVFERSSAWADWSKKKVVQHASPLTKEAAEEGSGESPTTTSKKLLLSSADVSAMATSSISSAGAAVRDIANIAPDTQEKIVHCMSVMNMMLTAWIAASGTAWAFPLWHSIKSPIYIAHRYLTFRSTKQHYLLFDFCYWALALSIVYVFLAGMNESFGADLVGVEWRRSIFRTVFMTANGPLAWAVLAFGQSLVFPSAPHMCSVFVHVSPALLSYTLRWHGRPVERVVTVNGTALTLLDPSVLSSAPFEICADYPACGDVSAWALLRSGMSFHFGWLVIYYILIYGFLSERIRSRGYQTLFNRIISRGPTRHLAKLTKNEMVQKTLYMGVHFVFSTLTQCLATIYFRYKAIHFIFCLAILAASSWNGATFFFSVFWEQRAQRAAEEKAKAEELGQPHAHHHHHHHHHHHQQEEKPAATATATATAGPGHNPLDDEDKKKR